MSVSPWNWFKTRHWFYFTVRQGQPTGLSGLQCFTSCSPSIFSLLLNCLLFWDRSRFVVLTSCLHLLNPGIVKVSYHLWLGIVLDFKLCTKVENRWYQRDPSKDRKLKHLASKLLQAQNFLICYTLQQDNSIHFHTDINHLLSNWTVLWKVGYLDNFRQALGSSTCQGRNVG